MKKIRLLNQLPEIMSKAKIKHQLYIIYVVAVFLPIVVLGGFLLLNTSKLLTSYHEDLMESDNLRVRTILFEITTQIYNISENISSSATLRSILVGSYDEKNNFLAAANKYTNADSYMSNYAEIDTIQIYTDNPDISSYKQYTPATEEIKETEWYQKAISQASVFWVPINNIDKYGNEYWSLCLVRKIPLVNSDYNGVLVIKISDNYLRTRIENSEYAIMVSVDEDRCFYSSIRNLYGKPQGINIDYTEDYFSYTGDEYVEGKKYLASVSTMHLYKSDSRIYVTTLNLHAYENIRSILWTCVLILGIATILPGIIIHFFTGFFTERINTLREEMHKASTEDYDIIPTFRDAILHGLEDREGNGQINICVSADEESLHIVIKDNGKGMTEGELEKVRRKLQAENPELNTSIGLYNINERIKLCYGKEHGIRIESVLSKGTDIFLDLPLSLAGQE